MLNKNYYVFTQGMLDKYFLKENFLKVLKKKIYWFTSNYKFLDIKIGDVIYDEYVRNDHSFIKPNLLSFKFFKIHKKVI